MQETKKEYAAPKLKAWGSMADLTQSGGEVGLSDGVWGSVNPPGLEGPKGPRGPRKLL